MLSIFLQIRKKMCRLFARLLSCVIKKLNSVWILQEIFRDMPAGATWFHSTDLGFFVATLPKR